MEKVEGLSKTETTTNLTDKQLYGYYQKNMGVGSRRKVKGGKNSDGKRHEFGW